MIIDKHFDENGFKFLRRLQPAKVNEARILIGKVHLSQDFKEIYKSFKEEMKNEGVIVDLRVLSENDEVKIHDRYLLGNDPAYVTPPWNIIHRKLGEIVKLGDVSARKRNFETYWNRASKIS